MAILIRKLTENQEEELEKAKTLFNEKTDSKTVIRMIEGFAEMMETAEKRLKENVELRRQLKQHKETYKQIKWNLDVLGDDEDDSEFY
ncbi:MAG: hypothetical protein CMP13_09740 [Zunongwangia sp.]|uniref:Uncharacterized protein n=2 Tax=Zunongwangia profunda TaxID=398743 RepID=D5BFA6_ZUNPS|nr:hypothetical protein [Zunongwangia profunda]ADF53004.1 hypothetical protein ZPR_2682 [Zunongwangia profunda SM-A87]MAS70890.1 hypothetical protein [Zunongwangia sp.]HCV79701.1 hypothetical protein [Zunongwangia profunda]|tara:strand:+ start:180 stop:443 length:264 start_codon:yes stop_codon:yes gene_type:complete